MSSVSNVGQYIQNHGYPEIKYDTRAYEDYMGWIEGKPFYDQIKVTVAMMNSVFAEQNNIFDAVTYIDTKAGIVETRRRKITFERKSHDTHGAGDVTTKEMIQVPFDDYGATVEVTRKFLDKDSSFSRQEIMELIRDMRVAYQTRMTILTLKALLLKPIDAVDTKSTPGFWREKLATFGIVPPSNGFVQGVAGDTHYLWDTMDDESLAKLKTKLSDKGYADNAIVFVGNQNTFSAYRKSFANDDITRMLAMTSLADNEFPKGNEFSGVRYVEVSNAFMPDGYIVAFDPNVKFLCKKLASEPELQGLVMTSTTNEQILQQRAIDFDMLEVGIGVTDRSAGAVMYFGVWDSSTRTFTPPSAYVNPDFSAFDRR